MSAAGTATVSGAESPGELASDEEFFLGEMLRLTGREDRLQRAPVLTEDQRTAFRAILPAVRESTKRGLDPEAKCDLLNRLLLGLGIKPFGYDLFKVVFENVDMDVEIEVHRNVERFRTIAMLEFGSFRYGYKVLRGGKGRHGESLSELWSRYFPEPKELTERANLYKRKPGPIGLIEIPPTQLSALGYLSDESTQRVNDARSKLQAVLIEAIAKGIKDVKELANMARDKDIVDLANLVAAAGLPDGERLLFPGFWAPGVPYRKIMDDAKESCGLMDQQAIKRAKRDGAQNTMTYMAMHDVDVYVATSMRDPLHFTNNHSFVNRLFKEGELSDWNLRYFDPTQSYVPDRILKGLTECLMIKRAAVTVYNAQEADTFGKDAEAAVALAQGKPVVVYVARLFPNQGRLAELYLIVDSAARTEKPQLIKALRARGFLSEAEETTLLAPGKSTMDCVEHVLNRAGRSTLSVLERVEIEAELIGYGYEPPRAKSLDEILDFACTRIVRLERRALTFREIHPLSLQASPIDGVARGVVVTRSVEQTARILRGLLVGGLEYDIVDGDQCWSLVERSTRSPVRVVTKDLVLTTAFWNEWETNH
jgi:hypothetical protein